MAIAAEAEIPFSSFENRGHRFDIFRGVPEILLPQLIEKSTEEHIQRWCWRDATERFTNETAVARQVAKGRRMYLLAQAGDLAGTIWYGAKVFPTLEFGSQDAKHTFALRIYKDYLRRGLTRPFMDATLEDYVCNDQSPPESSVLNGIWVDTTHGNVVEALNLNYGYTEIGRNQENIFMVLSGSQIQQKIGALSSVG